MYIRNRGVGTLLRTPLDQVFIGSCTNGRFEDLEVVANILSGKKVKVRTIVLPASRSCPDKSNWIGVSSPLFWKPAPSLRPPGCGPCLGAHMGVICEGETCLSTSNRNFKGRMGSEGLIYLSSPETAAASAAQGRDFRSERLYWFVKITLRYLTMSGSLIYMP